MGDWRRFPGDFAFSKLTRKRLVGRLVVVFGATLLALLPVSGSSHAARLPGPDPVIAAAGDMSCPQGPDGATNCRDKATSDLLVGQGLSRVLTLGDAQYEFGELSDFQTYYDPTWGRVKGITSPAPGNHDPFSSGYSAYFGSRAPGRYYSYDIGSWHLISLDSNNVDPGQVSWLRSDLAANAGGKCVLAYWHHARFTSGMQHGNDPTVQPFWTELYAAGADLVLNGHEHSYERFGPQDPNGTADAARGIREFVVGTGGKNVHPMGPPRANSEVRQAGTYGVLELALRPGRYEWLFVPEAGKTFSDSGTGVCHGASGGYARPSGAAPLRVSLVPSYERCTAPDSTHGSPLAHPACGSPAQTSRFITVGTADANGRPPLSAGKVRLDVIVGNPATPANEADFRIAHTLKDVRTQGDLSDYTGELRAVLGARITDKFNGPSATKAATVSDWTIPITVPCTATPGADGSNCNLITSANAVLPGAVRESKRAIWELERVAVYDGGQDSDADTVEDNTLFATQGIFVP